MHQHRWGLKLGAAVLLGALAISGVRLVAQSPEELLPLAVGNRWEYRGSMSIELVPAQRAQPGAMPGFGGGGQGTTSLMQLPAALIREVTQVATQFSAPSPVYEIRQEWQLLDAVSRRDIRVLRSLFASASAEGQRLHGIAVPAIGAEGGRQIIYNPPALLLRPPLQPRERWRVGQWRQIGWEGLEMTVYARCEGKEDIKAPLSSFRDAIKIFYYANDVHGSLTLPGQRPEAPPEQPQGQPQGQGQTPFQPPVPQMAQTGLELLKIIGGEMFRVEWYMPGVGMVVSKARYQLTTSVGNWVNAQLIIREEFGLATRPTLRPAGGESAAPPASQG